ncbi:predicted protein [Postia placenta Mad-698-R]|nr:predicted protein [Postia placenta Mad-698-R]
MKGLVFVGLNNIEIQERPKPVIVEPTDAIVKLVKTTVCGSNLHIVKGHVPYIPFGRIMGHEGLGIVETVGASVTRFRPGDHVVISAITRCGRCEFCSRAMYSHCTDGGFTLGNTVDGTQAEYVRIRHADDEDALVMASDVLPTGMECGVLQGRVQPGSFVAIVGMGPIGLSALMSAKLYSPSVIISLELDPARLNVARNLGATHAAGAGAVEEVMRLTGGEGVDAVIEAVGVPASFELCQELVAVGGTIANLGVHGASATIHLEKLWNRNITMTTRQVDNGSTADLMELIARGQIDAGALATHYFRFDEIQEAYACFSNAAANKALKVIVDFEGAGGAAARL